MAVYTLKILGVCSGGEHVSMNLLKDNSVIRRIGISKTELFSDPVSFDDGIKFFIRQTLRASDASTVAQAKTAIEAAEWVM